MVEQPDPPSVPEPPPLASWLQWGWHHYQANKEVFLKGPVLAGLLIAAVTGWWVGAGRNEEELRVAKQRISFLGDQVSAYKDRLQGATPDQAANAIATLQAGLAHANEKLQICFLIIQGL